MPLTDQQRRHLERRLREERGEIVQILGRYQQEQSAAERERAGDISTFPTHPADEGTYTYDAEVEASLAARATEELHEIDAALERLYHHPERFGVCERTGEPIPFARLDLIPWARTCDQERRPDISGKEGSSYD
jgi:RNA polymerase-binding transcription factor DksA